MKSDLIKRFLLSRIEWLIRGWFFCAGCWFMVILAKVFQDRPDLAADLISRVQG